MNFGSFKIRRILQMFYMYVFIYDTYTKNYLYMNDNQVLRMRKAGQYFFTSTQRPMERFSE